MIIWELGTTTDCTKVGLPIATLHEGMVIEWGDGARVNVTSVEDYVHEYAVPGEYHVVVHYDAWETVELAISGDADVSSPLAEARTSLAVINRIPPVANRSFAYLFYGYTGLRDIAEDLFDDHADKTDFAYAFAGCLNLMRVPDILFPRTAAVTDFTHTFAGCVSITAVPELLFAESVEGTVFDGAFSGCTSLAAVSDVLLATMFLNMEQALESVFSGCSGLSVVSG